MSVALRDYATRNNGGASSSSAQGQIPSGAVVGDLLVMQMNKGTNTGNPATPAGWTKLSEQGSSANTVVETDIYYKVCAGGDPGALTASFSLGATTTWTTRVWAFSGMDASPFTAGNLVSAFESSAVAAHSLDASAVTTSNDSLLLFFVTANSDIGNLAWSGGLADLQAKEYDASNAGYMSVGWLARTATGAVGTLTATQPSGTAKVNKQIVAFNVIPRQTVSPTAIASAEAFGSPTVTPGPVTVSPTGIASAEAFGTPTVSQDAQTIEPSGIASAEAFGSPTVTPGPVTVSPAGIASGEAFGTPTVSAAGSHPPPITGQLWPRARTDAPLVGQGWPRR